MNPTAFIRVINCPKSEEGSPVTIIPIADKGATVRVQIEENLFLEKTFIHAKRPKRATSLAESLALSLPPRTTTHCLANQYGFQFAECCEAESIKYLQ